MRVNGLIFLGLCLTIGAASVSAVELRPAPLQSDFASRLQAEGREFWLSASDDDWVVDGQKEKETATGTDLRERTGRKSVIKAAALSALVPGLGQMYNDRDVKARYFFAAEGLTWIAFGAFRIYGDWKKDDMIAFGNMNANAQLDGKSDEYLDWVGFYSSIDEFNTAGRVGDPERAYLPDLPEYHWVWQSEEDRETFRSLKNSSRESYRRADWMLWAAAINRVVSVIDAVLDARRANQVVDEGWRLGGIRYDIEIDPLATTRQFTLTVYPGF